MFEVGFSELLMVGLVALLAIGPEKLPKAARVAGFWMGRIRGMLAGMQDEIRQELMLEDMRQMAREHLDLQPGKQAESASGEDVSIRRGQPGGSARPDAGNADGRDDRAA